MHVLVATHRTQGLEPDDFALAPTGELVRLPRAHCGDPGCGCDRAFIGLASAQGTTSAVIVDRPDLTPVDLWSLLVDALGRDAPDRPVADDDLRDLAAEARFLVDLTGGLPVGTVLGRRGGRIELRAHAPMADGPSGPRGSAT